MEATLQDATVEGYESLISALQEFGDDAHVVAAAVFGRADVIATSNVRDSPESVIVQYGIAVQTPKDFLIHQWWVDPVTVAGRPLAAGARHDQARAHAPTRSSRASPPSHPASCSS